MPVRSVSIRGLPDWLIRDYLTALGAQPAGPAAARMRAPDWTVSWTSRRIPMPGGAFSLTQFDIAFEAPDDAVLVRIEDAFLKKAQRGGG